MKLIDHEQLKMETTALKEKFLERAGDYEKIKRKTSDVAQMLTHAKEKLRFTREENRELTEEMERVDRQSKVKGDVMQRLKDEIAAFKRENEAMQSEAATITDATLLDDYADKKRYAREAKARLAELDAELEAMRRLETTNTLRTKASVGGKTTNERARPKAGESGTRNRAAPRPPRRAVRRVLARPRSSSCRGIFNIFLIYGQRRRRYIAIHSCYTAPLCHHVLIPTRTYESSSNPPLDLCLDDPSGSSCMSSRMPSVTSLTCDCTLATSSTRALTLTRNAATFFSANASACERSISAWKPRPTFTKTRLVSGTSAWQYTCDPRSTSVRISSLPSSRSDLAFTASASHRSTSRCVSSLARSAASRSGRRRSPMNRSYSAIFAERCCCAAAGGAIVTARGRE